MTVNDLPALRIAVEILFVRSRTKRLERKAGPVGKRPNPKNYSIAKGCCKIDEGVLSLLFNEIWGFSIRNNYFTIGGF